MPTINNERGDAIGWVAVVVAVVALALSWIAYNRTGENLENQIQRQVDEAVMETGEATEEAGQEIQEGVDEAEQEGDRGPDQQDEGAQ